MAMTIRVSTSGFQELADYIENNSVAGGTLADPYVQALLQKLTTALYKNIYAATPMKDDPQRGSYPQGMLRESLDVHLDPSTGIIYASFGAPFAIYVLTGVSPQFMRWLLGSHVSFIGKSGDRVNRYVTFVGISNGRTHWYHPGTPPNNIFETGWKSSEVQNIVKQLNSYGLLTSIGYSFTPNASFS